MLSFKIVRGTELVSTNPNSGTLRNTEVSNDRISIQADKVRELIASQFPRFASLPVSEVRKPGWDNHSFRLGPDMLVRMPSAQRYADQVKKEQKWLPWLSSQVSCELPEPLFQGKPDKGYPWSWSIYRWIEGKSLEEEDTPQKTQIAENLAQFLCELHGLNASNGPKAGEHNFHRGGDLSVYDNETRQALTVLKDEVDAISAKRAWQQSLESRWEKEPVWLHGDLTPANMLVKEEKLRAIIDFGACGVGDPACDLSMAWTFFDGHARDVFAAMVNLDRKTWERARGWTLWKALISLRSQESLKSRHSARLKKIIRVAADGSRDRLMC